MRNLLRKTLIFLKSDPDESIAKLYKFIGYMVIFFQIFLWSQAVWLTLIENVVFLRKQNE